MKKEKHVLLPLLMQLAALLALSCSLPQGPGDQSPASAVLAVTTDASRNQGIYVNENGLKADILGYEEQEGRTVKCVEAVSIVPMSQSSASPLMGLKGGTVVKALVLGVRDDGRPGIWEIDADDSIHPVKTWKGWSSSCLPDSEDRGGALRGLFGWKYFPIALRADGAGTALIVGKAVNDGFKLGQYWSIEKGTTVGVYWKLQVGSHKHFVLVSPARVIGIGLEQAQLRHWKPRPPHGRASLVLSSLNLFFLSYYEDYLTELKVTREDPGNQEAFYWDAKEAVFGVKGLNKSQDAVIAKISREDVISFVADVPPDGGETPAQIVIDTYEPRGGLVMYVPADTYLTLYLGQDQDGNWLTAEDNNGNIDSGQNGSSRLYLDGLQPGQYFLKVTKGSTKAIGPYAVRVLSVADGAGLPAYPTFPTDFDFSIDPYENMDAPEEIPPLSKTPVSVKVGVNNLFRILDSVDDVDWILVEIPNVVIPQPK
jgi:hypothetical protein